MRVAQVGPAKFQVLNKQANPTKSVLNPIGVNLMNDRSKIAEHHAKGGDVIAHLGEVDPDFGSHSSSPVVCDSFTLENRSGRGSPPSTPAAAPIGGSAQ